MLRSFPLMPSLIAVDYLERTVMYKIFGLKKNKFKKGEIVNYNLKKIAVCPLLCLNSFFCHVSLRT